MTGLARIKTDLAKEINGVAITLDDAVNEDGSIPTFTLARTSKSNTLYSKTLAAAVKPHQRHIQLGIFSNEKSEEIMLNVFLDTILKGWANVQDAEGNPIPFNKANARELMEAQPDVYDRLTNESNLAANYYMDSLEQQAKN